MRIAGLVAAVLLLLGISSNAAESTKVSLISLTPLIYQSEAQNDFGGDYELQITSLDNGSVNGEMTLAVKGEDYSGYSHKGYFILRDLIFGDVYTIFFELNVPSMGDANGNGIDDFFDSTQPVPPTATDGLYRDPVSGNARPFSASWQREATNNTGLVTISIPDLGLNFNTIFRFHQFDGKFDYTRNGTDLVGQVAFTNLFNPSDTITGPLTLKIQDTNTLTYAGGTWSGINDFTYEYFPEDNLDRINLTYLSFIFFTDGDLASVEGDFHFWFLAVTSTDANGNDIPDLVETGVIVTPNPPSMAAGKLPGAIQIMMTGTAGQTYELQGADALGDTWTKVQDVSLAGETASVTLESSGTHRFYRLVQP
jgi:hypothetical protein